MSEVGSVKCANAVCGIRSSLRASLACANAIALMLCCHCIWARVVRCMYCCSSSSVAWKRSSAAAAADDRCCSNSKPCHFLVSVKRGLSSH